MSTERIFITGGASGLGRALAERYARTSARVCIADVNDARGAETLDALRRLGATAHYLRTDVTSEEQLQAAADWLSATWGGVDVVVNNAGVAVGGGIAEVSVADWQWIIDINLLGVVRGCRVFTPVFRRQQRGHLVNVASLAGLIHPPMMSAYNATKAAVVALSETLRVELAPDKIDVSVACPAFFRTNLTETLRAGSDDVAQVTHRLVNKARRGADEIAELVYAGIRRRDFHILTHADGTFVWLLKRLTPFSWYSRAMGEGSRRMMSRRKRPEAPPG